MMEPDIISRLHTSLEVGAVFSTMSNEQIADLLIRYVWADMDMTSPQAVLIYEAIERLNNEKISG